MIPASLEARTFLTLPPWKASNLYRRCHISVEGVPDAVTKPK